MELNSNVTINIVELASELAHIELEKHFNYSSIDIYEEAEAGISNYTNIAQDFFNDLYDKYYSIIENCKVHS